MFKLRNVAANQCLDNGDQGFVTSDLTLQTCDQGYSPAQSLFLDAFDVTSSRAAELRPTVRFESVSGTSDVAFYAFNEGTSSTAADSSGNGNDAALLNGASFTGAGQLEGAVDINGGSQHVDLPDGFVERCDDFTFASWVRLDSNPTWGRIFDFGNDTNTEMYLTPAAGNPDTLRFAIKVPFINGGVQQIVAAPFTFPLNIWTHVAVVLEGDVGTLYVNGAPISTKANFTAIPADLGNSVNNWLGQSQWPDPNLDGKLDEVWISCRAFSQQEVSDLAEPSAAALEAAFIVDTDWGGGYCGHLDVTNLAAVATSGWSVALNMNGTTVTGSWNGDFSGNSGAITVTAPFEWNQVIAPGSTDSSIGFCASRPSGNALPTNLTAAGSF